MFFKKKIAPQDLSDEELLVKYLKSSDSELIGILFNRYSHLVFGLCMKYLKNVEESKDAVMQIFEKIQGDLRRHQVSHFKSWIYMVSKNHCLMQLRKAKPEVIVESLLDIENLHVESDLGLHLYTETEDKLQELEKNIFLLNTEQRKCIQLFYLEERSYKEVSELTGYSLLQVKSHIQNGKRNLKALLVEKYGDRQNG